MQRSISNNEFFKEFLQKEARTTKMVKIVPNLRKQIPKLTNRGEKITNLFIKGISDDSFQRAFSSMHLITITHSSLGHFLRVATDNDIAVIDEFF